MVREPPRELRVVLVIAEHKAAATPRYGGCIRDDRDQPTQGKRRREDPYDRRPLAGGDDQPGQKGQPDSERDESYRSGLLIGGQRDAMEEAGGSAGRRAEYTVSAGE